jgi:cytolysin-activating lysine-acyltransferase
MTCALWWWVRQRGWKAASRDSPVHNFPCHAAATRLRAQVQTRFGKIVMAMMVRPTHRHQTLADPQPLVQGPLLRDRIAIAHPKGTDRAALVDISGFAIWASVSQEVDAKIREQIKTGTFPIRLKPEDWQSGEINWLLDVIAPDAKATGQVIANFRQVVKEGDLRVHPLVAGLVDAEMRGKMMGGTSGDGTLKGME